MSRAKRPPAASVELAITALAAGGDGVGRDERGRVTFVPRTCPGDVVRARVVHATKSFARARLVEVLAAAPERVDPPCPHFVRGCGGCQWQHVARSAQLAAKHAIVCNALRKLAGLTVHPVDDPAPAYHWRRRARFHIAGGTVGLYVEGSHEVLPIDHCPQLEPALDRALAAVAAASPPDGELALVLGHRGDVAVGVQRPWRSAGRLVGTAGIRGVLAGDDVHGEPVIEVEPGLWGGPWDFAQASAAGNARLIERTRAALGRGPGRLLELYAGAGNFTRAFVEDGWRVVASDVVAPARASSAETSGAVERVVGPAGDVVAALAGPFDAVVLDPPRAGAAEIIEHVARLAPRRIVYVSCDPATLARDAMRLAERGYRADDAWPVDLMPQTSHIEVVLRLTSA